MPCRTAGDVAVSWQDAARRSHTKGQKVSDIAEIAWMPRGGENASWLDPWAARPTRRYASRSQRPELRLRPSALTYSKS